MKKNLLAWWAWPAVITGSIAAITTLGTIFMMPGRVTVVEAEVKQNSEANAKQDIILERLTTLQEIYQEQKVEKELEEEIITRKNFWGKKQCCDKSKHACGDKDDDWEKCE